MTTMRIGIFGGSYNPIHTGHAIIAQHIIGSGLVDQLWMMVSPVNPLKAGNVRQVADTDRLRMVEMVTRHIEGVETSAFEFTMPRPSYTIDTLNALQAKFPDDEFYLVTLDPDQGTPCQRPERALLRSRRSLGIYRTQPPVFPKRTTEISVLSIRTHLINN